ncbi:hypothetical protein [Gillisia limnaea]|uniref:Lipoprotein n=1 Tax=Gillisia limnaea (strain DSM 15749 / LMG 21470 / R-8282) TaxID=865937 RepID=H2BU15_GILLR|nr:hypothetical protein [Gillisia limnaea]EHQ01611.1 hypothetical protein Gilli_0924 [Gillisia limnaea DSM 15749]
MKNTILFGLCIVLISCGRSSEEQQLSEKVDSLKNEIVELKQANDTLSDHLIKKAHVARNYPEYFDSIAQPEKFVLDRLQEAPGLIPKEAVLGGTMRFTTVYFINDELIVAEYEDGHVMGKSIFRYRSNIKGNLEFKPIAQIQD